MKVVILCGGKGTRLKEYTEDIPKPLIEIGNRPIIWHIMKIYSHYGFNEFILCLGYKGNEIKKYFIEEKWKINDLTIKTGSEYKLDYHSNDSQDWKITFVDTGQESNKAERLLKIKPFLEGEDDFFLAYGDDVTDVNIQQLLDFHKRNNKMGTITAINLVSPFGVLTVNQNDEIEKFEEKPVLDYWINGGFMVMNKKIFDYIKPGYDLEKEVFKEMSSNKEILVYKHAGFWKCMNTFKETVELNELWNSNLAPWKVWK